MSTKASFLAICNNPPSKGGWTIKYVRQEAARLGLDITGKKEDLCNRIADKVFSGNVNPLISPAHINQPTTVILNKTIVPVLPPIIPVKAPVAIPILPPVKAPAAIPILPPIKAPAVIPILPPVKAPAAIPILPPVKAQAVIPILPPVKAPILSSIPPPPPLLSSIPPPPLLSSIPPPPPKEPLTQITRDEPERCNFCCEVNAVRARYDWSIPLYCGAVDASVCRNCKHSQYDIEGDDRQQEFAREIFRDIVLDIETKNIYGEMIKRVNFSFASKFITSEQQNKLINDINVYRQRFEDYVNDIINYNRYKPPAGSGIPYTNLTGSFDWAQAIIILRNWFITHFQEEFTNLLASYQTSDQRKFLQKYCTSKPYNKCPPPCTPDKGVFLDTCEYKPIV
ncbi:Hypothetical protein HVR_LOCUS713 [uncultured virus]|nr:Hypothetical protein HVR_LOCUS713 [uncultured virus]